MKTTLEYDHQARMFHAFVPKTMGTKFDFLYIGAEEKQARELWDGCEKKLSELSQMLNRFSSESEVFRVNAAPHSSPVTISEELYEIVGIAEDFWEKTEGLFDITRGNMVHLCREGGKLIKECEGVTLDFGGIAKGYFLKWMKEELKGNCGSAFVDFGNSSILTVGSHPFGDSWKVALPNPYNGEVVEEFGLKDTALSVSGNTPHYNGHIINPITQVPVVERKMVSVLSPDPLEAEVLSTVLMFADRGQEMRILKRYPDIKINKYKL